MYSYKRPESIPYPNIWHRFKARDCDSDEIVNYYIQDVPEDRFDDAIEQMVHSYCYEEPTNASKSLII